VPEKCHTSFWTKANGINHLQKIATLYAVFSKSIRYSYLFIFLKNKNKNEKRVASVAQRG